MTEENMKALLDRFKQEARRDKTAKLLRAWDLHADNSLAAFDALGIVGRHKLRVEARATLPSPETWAQVRAAIAARPLLRLLKDEPAYEPDLDTAEDSYDR